MHGALVHDDHIWVIGAENGTPDDVWKSKDGVNWELVAATVRWQERGNQLVTVFDGSVFNVAQRNSRNNLPFPHHSTPHECQCIDGNAIYENKLER